MINVNSSEIEKELMYLNKLITEYEDNYLSLFRELNSSSLFWKDGKSELFFDTIPKEKIKNDNYYQEIKNVQNIYTYILEQYKKIGNKINIDLNYQEAILKRFDKIILELENIKSLYEHLDTSFCIEEKGIILNELKDITQIIEIIKDEKNRIKNLLEKIESIEMEISTQINKIKITYIKDYEIDNYI